MASSYGQIVPGWAIEKAVEATLREWMDEYCAEVRDQWSDSPELPPIRSYGTRSEAVKFVDDQLPAVVIVSPGIDGDIRASGDGWIEAPWRVGCVTYCAGKTEAETRNRAQGYGAALRACLLQQDGLGGLSTGVSLVAEDYTPGPTERGRTFGAVIVEFTYTIACTVNRRMGPTEHGSNAPGPPVESTELGVHRTVDTSEWEA
jgi:hypothetical protein